MADRTPSTTIPLGGILITGNNVHNLLAGTAITAGQVVAIHGTGVNFTVWPSVLATTAVPIGVALESAASGRMVPVAGIGCICYVQQETDDTDIDAGTELGTTDTAGLVGALVDGAPPEHLAGIALADDDASALTWFPMLVLCGLLSQVHA